MSTKTSTKPWTSGFCAPSNDKASHGRCHGHNGQGKACSCTQAFEDGTRCHTISEATVDPRTVVSDPTPAGAAVATTPPPLVITQPCVYDDMPEDVYHAPWTVPKELGGSLSNTGAKTLLSKTPAHFQWERDNGGRANKRHFDYGHAVHTRVLGDGTEIVRIQADDYRTKAAQDAKKQAYAEGKTPLLRDEVDEVGDIAEAVLKHPLARRLFEADTTIREQSMFWQDPETGIYLRCRPDSRFTAPSGRVMCVDLKSLISANPDAFGKTADNNGYHQQHPFYLDGLQAHDLADETSTFLFVLVEKEPPYLVSVVELDDEAVQVGRDRNRRAVDLFASCTQTGLWPGYSTAVEAVSLPYWSVKQHIEEYAA